MIETEYTAPRQLVRAGNLALLAGVVGLVLLVLGALLPKPLGGAEQFWRSYMLGWTFWLGIALGSLGILMIQHLSGGVWGATLRRFLEAAAMTIPLMGLLFVPVAVFGMHAVYEWSHPGFMVGEVLEQKAAYLNEPFFFVRMVIYFVVWSVLAWLLYRWSREYDRTGDHRLGARLTRLSGPGMVLYAITMTLAMVDLLLSLDAEFYSTIWGGLVTFGMILAAFSMMIVVLALLTVRGPLDAVISGEHFLDVGKLLLAFTIVWTYLSFSQFLIIYSGNLPVEAQWYVTRLQGGWEWVGLALLLFQFALPFLLLLSRGLKRDPRMLVYVAALAFFMQYVYLIWLMAPNWHPDSISLSWMDLAAPVGFGGLFLIFFTGMLNRRPLLPLHVLPRRHPRARTYTEAQHAGQ
jgi:hypothetical protein